MENTALRQFALLQLERISSSLPADSPLQDRVWAALYCVQAMDDGPMPDDIFRTIDIARDMDQDV
jgi:hypothetical protein